MSVTAILQPEEYQSAFVVKPSSLGDIVHTLPAVHLLKKAHPHLQIRWVCNPEWIPLLEGNTDIAEIIPFPRQQFKGPQGLARFFSWSRQLNSAGRQHPEMALDFQGLLRSALICQARGTDPILGLSDAREGASLLYRHVIPVEASAHAVDRYLEMVRALGVEVETETLKFPLPAGRMPAGIKGQEEFIVLHPYARGAGKSLTAECIQTLCDCLAPRRVLIVGRHAAPAPVTGAHVTSLVNQTDLQELLWLLRHAQATVSVDSGPMHIAAAVTDRALGIHTWSDPRKVGPYNPKVPLWKAGRIATRSEFSDTEAVVQKNVETSDARRIADFILRSWY